MTPPCSVYLWRPFLTILSLPLISTNTITITNYTGGFPFNKNDYSDFHVLSSATISNNALQITPNSAGNFTLFNRYGRILLSDPIHLFIGPLCDNKSIRASFHTSFVMNIYRPNTTNTPGEGMAFIISPDLSLPPSSSGKYLGLTNTTIDGDPWNQLLAIEFDTFKNDPFDPNDNHIGLNINSIRSSKTISLSNLHITLAPPQTMFHKVWIHYDAPNKSLTIFITELGSNMFSEARKPYAPAMRVDELDLSQFLNNISYFGFSASTGLNSTELHSVLSWNLTVFIQPPNCHELGVTGRRITGLVGLLLGLPLGLLICAGTGGYCWMKKWGVRSDPNIMGALKSLPVIPREYEYKDLKKATGNFDEKNKLGQGGYGVVYKGYWHFEDVEVAVKEFPREEIKSKDDFLAELTIINRLRHRNLVKLLGWCHKNEMLLLVYKYMSNGRLDKHIFCDGDNKPLSWILRFKALKGVASALNYLHNEFDEKVIHRDLKASNVMLDHNFNARLGDFGLAHALDHEKTSCAEMEGVHGTMGYIAPECLLIGKATRESDIYGFGAMLLEVACGLRPWTKKGGFHCLVDWVWSMHRDGSILGAVDERLEKDYVVEEAERVLLLGLACSHPIASDRPKTQVILQILSGSVPVPYVPPFKPSFVWPALGPMEDTTADTTPISSSQYDQSGWTPRSVSSHSGYINHSMV